VRPLSLAVERTPEAGWRAYLRLAGLPAALDGERAWLAEHLPGTLADERRGPAARAAAETARDRVWAHRRAGPFARATGPFTCLEAVLEELERLAPPPAALVVEPGIAIAEAALGEGADLAPVERRLGAHPGAVVQAFDGQSGPWPALSAASPAASGVEVMRALKRRLDPDGLFAREV
jgi:FAD/FMN-containing dehydrogenase